MKCAFCAQSTIGLVADYRRGCFKCAARSVARSGAMQISMDTGRPKAERDAAGVEVRALISRTMPHVPYADARTEVLRWWDVDEPMRAVAQKG